MAQKDPQLPEDHADVVTATAEDAEEGVSGGSFERASGQAPVVFHVTDHRLDGAASAQKPGDRFGDTTPGAADEDPHVINAVAAIPSVHKGHIWSLIGQDFDL